MKFTLPFLLFLSISLFAHAEDPQGAKCTHLIQPLVMSDEVAGLSLGNTHEVFSSENAGRLIRGHEPGPKAKQLTDIGVTDVVIYKVDTKGEVAKEVAALKKLGLPDDQVHVIAMPWKDITEREIPCRQTIEALNILLKVARTPGRTGYFHCSAGQDRTGMLSGILRMVTQGWSAERAFYSEMCNHGFGFGDVKRPAHVSLDVEENLTPIFLQLAAQIQGQDFSLASNLDASLCTSKPKKAFDESQFKCR